MLWICDPMHGNTESTAGGVKTRRFDNILAELKSAFRVHRESGSSARRCPSGADRRECHRMRRAAHGVSPKETSPAPIESQVDPRLNYEQAMEIAMEIAGE